MHKLTRFGFVAAALFVITTLCGQQAAADTRKGTPRDIDYIDGVGQTQIILSSPPMDDLIAVTKTEPIVRILLVALMLKTPASVEYMAGRPARLTSATLSLTPASGDGQVLQLSYNEIDKKYRATVVDHGMDVKVWTDSPQMQGILESAAQNSIPVKEFSYDATTKKITRGKLNISLDRKK
jgi:hypothetical protein